MEAKVQHPLLTEAGQSEGAASGDIRQTGIRFLAVGSWARPCVLMGTMGMTQLM